MSRITDVKFGQSLPADAWLGLAERMAFVFGAVEKGL